jgi:preprotein translocase subunit SecY
MLRAFANAFKIPDLRGKILFTLAIIAVYRFGSYVPIPGVDYGVLQGARAGGASGVAQLINLFSGGALTSWRCSRSGSCRTSPRASSCSC